MIRRICLLTSGSMIFWASSLLANSSDDNYDSKYHKYVSLNPGFGLCVIHDYSKQIPFADLSVYAYLSLSHEFSTKFFLNASYGSTTDSFYKIQGHLINRLTGADVGFGIPSRGNGVSFSQFIGTFAVGANRVLTYKFKNKDGNTRTLCTLDNIGVVFGGSTCTFKIKKTVATSSYEQWRKTRFKGLLSGVFVEAKSLDYFEPFTVNVYASILLETHGVSTLYGSEAQINADPNDPTVYVHSIDLDMMSRLLFFCDFGISKFITKEYSIGLNCFIRIMQREVGSNNNKLEDKVDVTQGGNTITVKGARTNKLSLFESFTMFGIQVALAYSV